MPLNHKQCLSLEKKPKPYKVPDGGGLYLQVMPNGSKLWRFRYRYAGKEKQIAFGGFPEIGIQLARDQHAKARLMLREGTDPSAKRKEAKQIAIECPSETFKEFALEWHARKTVGWSERHAFNIMSRLKGDIFPQFGDVAIDKIKPSHIIKAIDLVNERGAHDIARRTLNYCFQVFQYAVGLDKITFNPAKDRTEVLIPREVQHFASIHSDDLPAFLVKLDHFETPILPQTRLATRLLMLTFVRTKELTEAPWSEFNFDTNTWIIPAKRMKKRRDHIVPLSRQAVEILLRLKAMAGRSPHVFPSRSNLAKTMSNATILGGLKRMGYKGIMTGHGFRALAATTLREKLRQQRDVIDLQLAHKPIDKSNPYDRTQFLEERAVLMQIWADYIDAAQAKGASAETHMQSPA